MIKAARSPKPVGLTLIANWAIKPFTMAFFAWLFLSVIFGRFLDPAEIERYRAGTILLGVAPCTAMVLVWSYLARGNMGHTLVMSAINSLTMVVLYAPLAVLLLGIAGISVPWDTIALSVTIYIVTPLIAGYSTRRWAIRGKEVEWSEARLEPKLGKVSIIALLITLVVLFICQGHIIVALPAIAGMVTLAILVNILSGLRHHLSGCPHYETQICRRYTGCHHRWQHSFRGCHSRRNHPLRSDVRCGSGYSSRCANRSAHNAVPGMDFAFDQKDLSRHLQ
ncbi:MAG TPA: bile acid:sodium symporter [Dehalococcoidales bacterium]|nr:bile acid:sodium symporter [Dehalococcoidales bacterium]